MRAGPKRAVTAAPLDLSGLPRSGGNRAIAFIEQYLLVPKGHGARQPVRLRPWQRSIVKGLLDETTKGRRAKGEPSTRPRQALVAMPRGNGKTTLCAMLSVFGLYGDDQEGARVFAVGADERQARLTFDAARRMVELAPALAEQVQVFHDRLYVPHTDSTLSPLPAEAHRLLGLDPTLVIVDELASVPGDVWDSVALAAGKRDRSLTLAISTPASDHDGPMWRLIEHGRKGDDPDFYLKEYAAPDGCAVDDERAWRVANPALGRTGPGDFLSLAAMRATLRTTPEHTFRQYRLGQWVGHAGSWLEWGLWESRANPSRVVAPGERVVLGFDGSASGDSTALVGCTLDGFVFLVGCWANDGDERWRVARHEVDGAVADAFGTYEVLEIAADPWGWRSEIEGWSARWPNRVIEWPTNIASRMAPATDRAFQGVASGALTHDGNPQLAAHVNHCVARRTPLGDLVSKDRRMSPRKIDAAVAMIVAYDRAAWAASQPVKRRRVVSF